MHYAIGAKLRQSTFFPTRLHFQYGNEPGEEPASPGSLLSLHSQLDLNNNQKSKIHLRKDEIFATALCVATVIYCTSSHNW